MSQDNAEVLQGRLGWERGDVSAASPDELEPHPKNKEIYGDTNNADELPDTFVNSIREKGVLEPLVITQGKQIISGHRRWIASKSVGVDSVPVRYADFDTDLAEREALIEFNRQREKTPGQIVNEFEEMLEVEKERAKGRKESTQLKGKTKDGNPDFGSGNVSNTDETGSARDKAADKVNAGVSGRTLEKGLDVKKKAEEGNETAKKEWEKLESGSTSFHRAKKNVEKSEAEKEVEEQKSAESKSATITKAEAQSFIGDIEPQSVDLLITDPPYSTDVEDITGFAQSWVPEALARVKQTGFAFICIGAYPDEIQAYLNVIENATDWSCEQVLVWTYKNTLGQTPNNRYKLNWQAILYLRGDEAPALDSPKTSEQWAVQEINAPDGRHGDRYHMWEKPSKLADRLIRHTTGEGDEILDPFAGTGTFAIKAAELGRVVNACDKSDEMLSLAEERGCVIDD